MENDQPPAVRIQRQVISGPLPSPATLADYHTIDPSFPERIVRMAEKEQEAAHTLQRQALEIENLVITTHAAGFKRGQFLAFLLAMLFLAGSVYLAISGQEKVALSLSGITLIAIITVIVTGRIHKIKNSD